MTLSPAVGAELAHGFPQPKRISLADSIADSVAEAIATRHVLPGERIVELTLAERLGVSRVPIREALKVLHAQGILTGGSHRGYRVAAFDAKTTREVMEVRLLLESVLLRDAIARFRSGEADPGVLEEPIRWMRQAASMEDLGASLRADLAFHRAIRLAAANEIAGTLWDAIARHVLIIFSTELYRDNDPAAVAGQHESFRDFILACVRTPVADEIIRRALEDHFYLVARNKRRSAGEASQLPAR